MSSFRVWYGVWRMPYGVVMRAAAAKEEEIIKIIFRNQVNRLRIHDLER